jgi:2TM family of unknown function (DUF5676)
MSSTIRSVKVGAAWITIAYVICFAGVALFPNIRVVFLQDALHMEANFLGRDIITVRSFVAGLIWWNALMFFGVTLFRVLDGVFSKQ